MASVQRRFGQAVRRLREKQGYSQEELARVARFHRTYASEIERGKTNISLAVIERIAKALKMSLAELFRAVDDER
ncbi:MAG: helix-turn-helix domain-containing protein [Gemmatimonadaceae bacterium]